MSEVHLYLVFMDPDPGGLCLARPAIRLGSGLYICHTAATRSRFYHALKASCHPQKLLVAPLEDAPKFKGMAPGAAKALRRQNLPRGEVRPGTRLSPASATSSGVEPLSVDAEARRP